MPIKLWLAGCCNEQPTGPNEMVPAKYWDTMVWQNQTNATVRYNHWKDGHFKTGQMAQIFLAEVTLDLFSPENNSIVFLASAAHPFQKTVVYNQQKELETVVSKGLKSAFSFTTGQIINNNYQIQGDMPEVWNDTPFPAPAAAPSMSTPEPDWTALYNILHNQQGT